jgi:hypothetical protein
VGELPPVQSASSRIPAEQGICSMGVLPSMKRMRNTEVSGLHNRLYNLWGPFNSETVMEDKGRFGAPADHADDLQNVFLSGLKKSTLMTEIIITIITHFQSQEIGV